MERNSRIELLRIVLMFLIVLHHCCLFGPYRQDMLLGALSTVTRFHVDAFVFISGWFGITLKFRRLVGLLGIGLFSVAIVGIAGGLAGLGWDFRFSLGWFGNAYVALMLMSPLMNAGIEGLRKTGESPLRIAWMFYAAAMLLNWIPGVGLPVPGWDSHSFNTCMFMYVSGRVFSRCEWLKSISLRWLVAAIICLETINIGFAYLFCSYPTQLYILADARGYNAPFVMALAVCVFLVSLKLPVSGDKWVNKIAASMFTVYLMHNGIPNQVPKVFCSKCIYAIGRCGDFPGMHILACVLGAMIVMATCVLLDILRRVSLKWVFSKWWTESNG